MEVTEERILAKSKPLLVLPLMFLLTVSRREEERST